MMCAQTGHCFVQTAGRILSLAILILAFSPLTACQTVQDVIGRMDKPTAKVKNVDVQDLSLEGLTLGFDVDVTNPYSVALPLTDLAYRLSTSNQSLVSGSAALSGSIPARGSKIVTIPAHFNFAEVLNAAPSVRPGAVVPYEANLTMSVDAPGVGPLKLPLRSEGLFPIPTVPDVSIERFKWSQLTLNKASAVFDLKIRNGNEFALGLSALDYGLSLGGYDVISTKIANSTSISADGVETLQIPISISPLKLGMAAFSMLQGSGSGYTIAGTMDVDTAFGQLSLPFQRTGQTVFD